MPPFPPAPGSPPEPAAPGGLLPLTRRTEVAAAAPEEPFVAVVADAHLGTGPGGPAAALVEQLEALPAAGCVRLLLLGDIQHLWIGDARYGTDDIEELAAALRRLRAAGLRVDYIEGNRDFFLAEGPWADAFDTVGREIAFTAGGERVLAVHGDGLDRRDWKYRFWRAVSKSAPMAWIARSMPRRWARRTVDSTERALAETNLDHKRHIPEDALRAWAADRLAEGHDRILLGHFHEPREWRLEGGRVCLVDAWFQDRGEGRLQDHEQDHEDEAGGTP